MNNTFIIRLSEVTAEQLLKIDDDRARIKTAYLRFLAREPTPAEQTRAAEFLNTFHDGGDTSSRLKSAWTAFCQALFGSAPRSTTSGKVYTRSRTKVAAAR